MGIFFEVTENIEQFFEARSLIPLLYNNCFILDPFLPYMPLGLKMAFREGSSRMTLEQHVSFYIKKWQGAATIYVLQLILFSGAWY